MKAIFVERDYDYDSSSLFHNLPLIIKQMSEMACVGTRTITTFI